MCAAFLASLVGLFRERKRQYAIAGLALSVLPLMFVVMMWVASVAVRLCS